MLLLSMTAILSGLRDVELKYDSGVMRAMAGMDEGDTPVRAVRVGPCPLILVGVRFLGLLLREAAPLVEATRDSWIVD